MLSEQYEISFFFSINFNSRISSKNYWVTFSRYKKMFKFFPNQDHWLDNQFDEVGCLEKGRKLEKG